MANGLEFLPPVGYLPALFDVGPDPVAGDIWVWGQQTLGLHHSPGPLCFLGQVMVGFEVGDEGAGVLRPSVCLVGSSGSGVSGHFYIIPI